MAAGSERYSGMGIWILFPIVPVGPSTEWNFFGYKEAAKTALTEFKDNTAHSNGNMGLALFKRLGEVHDIIGCSQYSPRADPLDPESDLVPVVFDGFVGNVHISCEITVA